MRYATMQLLTWGTIAGSVLCALWLATLGGGSTQGGAISIAAGVEQLFPIVPVGNGAMQRRHQAAAPAMVASAGAGSQPSR